MPEPLLRLHSFRCRRFAPYASGALRSPQNSLDRAALPGEIWKASECEAEDDRDRSRSQNGESDIRPGAAGPPGSLYGERGNSQEAANAQRWPRFPPAAWCPAGRDHSDHRSPAQCVVRTGLGGVAGMLGKAHLCTCQIRPYAAFEDRWYDPVRSCRYRPVAARAVHRGIASITIEWR